jgi:elongation factor 1-gamma
MLCFMLLPGMYQRLDKMRKNSFASMCLFGSDNDSSISGIWVWRGQDLAFEVSSLIHIIVKYDCC